MSPEIVDSFKDLESTREDMLLTHDSGEKGSMGPHIVRLPMGLVPQYIKLTPFQAMAWRIMGTKAKAMWEKNPNDALEMNLLKAHMKIRPEEFMAYAMLAAVFAGVGGVGIGLFTVLFMGGTMALLGLMAIPMLPIMVYFGLISSPAGAAKRRGADINFKLPAAMNLVAALASANVNIDVIFKELSRQTLYGELQSECEWITRDTELLGMDIITAIKRAAARSPSERFQDFLQGVVTTTTSGGQLKPYFIMKSEQYEKEEKLELKSRVETLGLMAESFVTIGVAFPLFLVIIMSIFAIISPGAEMIMLLLYVVVFGMIPGIQGGFVMGLTAIGGKVE